ncbi:MAG: DUF2177 family protein [Candidatus Pacebacteria bacterium]|nr:DUF2177 family protein [Candidatus Paceibacterota bacterium]MCD8508435.1 DUF2177 family protein [Candidatus Paceibacterota bacterium]MCD8527992.1 DUF2177 family protein [Candidatus Paceibacterota bacterium]MCD8563923.1 DUF2177 family protein [Candidatus Paceibacterota bacterium]
MHPFFYFLLIYSIALPVFFIIDMLWLGIVARSFYAKHLGHMMRSPILWSAAIIFYMLFVGGLVFFAIMPALAETSLMRAIIYGGLFGFMTYATYDLTNLATLKNWPIIVTAVDLLWGTVLGALVSGVTYGVTLII